MADESKKRTSVFSGVLDAINSNRRKTTTIDAQAPGMGVTQTMPSLDPKGGVENMQQQYLDWQVNKISHDLYTRTVYYDTDRISAYQDFRAMDGTPEIAAALNIIRDECVVYSLSVPLVCGESLTVEELYQQNYKNFEVYSYNPILKRHEPALCEKVVYKGEQDCYKVTFDDDSYIETTSEHLWLLKGKNEYTKTSDLKEGVSIEPFYSELLKSDNYKVKSIEYSSKQRTYDLVNVGEHNNFAVLTSDKKSGVFVHNCLTRSERGNILEVYSENKRVKQVLNDLFKNVLNTDFNLRLWIRDLVKYGDYFVMLQVDKEVGIYDFLTLPMEEVHREEGYDGRTSSTRFRWETTGDYFEEWQIAHFRLLEDSRKLPYGRCLKFDTYIDTKNGVSFIKDIKKGDFVYSFDTKTHKKIESEVLDVVCSGKKEIFKIRTKNNEIESSIEHKLLAYENENFVYKNVDELKINDLLVIEKENFNINENIKIDKSFIKESINWNDYKKNVELIPDFVDEDFAKLFGFMLGDGWISNNAVYIALGVNDEINNKYCSLLNKFSGKEIKLKKNPAHKRLEFQQAHVNSRLLKDILINMEFYGKSYEKRLPKWIFTAPKNIKEALIEGLVDADGCENTDEWGCKRYVVELSNEYLIKDLKVLLQRTGRKCGKICTRDRKETVIWEKKYNTRKSFYIYFYDSELKQCLKHDIENRKDDNFILAPIISIENTFEVHETYDIYVKNDNHNFYANGIVVHNSLLDSSRKLWKQLQLAEDAMLVYRITRAPERRVFYIEVGNLPDLDVKGYMGKVQNQIRKQPIVDVRTGNMTQKYDPENVTEDYWIPIRGDKSSRIETLPGAQNLGDIADIEYLQNKLFAALQVPKTYLNFGDSMPGGSTLSQADIRFSRTINSIQEAILLELRRVANVHLYFLGFEDDLDNFHLTLTNPSTQQELLKLETMKARLEVFKEFFNTEATSPASYTWSMENILGFSKSDIKLILKQKKVEKKIFAEIDSAVETYKKIGLFDDLDERYEDPDAAASFANGGVAAGEESGGMDSGGGGGFSGLGGGLSLGAGGMGTDVGSPDTGASPPEGEDAGATTPEGGDETPLAESRIAKVMKRSDRRMGSFINELLGPDEDIIKLMKERAEDDGNVLFEKNKSMNIKTKQLLESLDKTLNSVEVDNDAVGVITESQEENSDILFESNEKNNQRTQEMFDDLDKITSAE